MQQLCLSMFTFLAKSAGRNTHQRVSLPPCGDSDCVNTDFEVNIFEFHNNLTRSHGRGPFHKSSYEQVLLYEFVEPVLNYIGLTNSYLLRIFVKRGPVFCLGGGWWRTFFAWNQKHKKYQKGKNIIKQSFLRLFRNLKAIFL